MLLSKTFVYQGPSSGTFLFIQSTKNAVISWILPFCSKISAIEWTLMLASFEQIYLAVFKALSGFVTTKFLIIVM